MTGVRADTQGGDNLCDGGRREEVPGNPGDDSLSTEGRLPQSTSTAGAGPSHDAARKPTATGDQALTGSGPGTGDTAAAAAAATLAAASTSSGAGSCSTDRAWRQQGTPNRAGRGRHPRATVPSAGTGAGARGTRQWRGKGGEAGARRRRAGAVDGARRGRGPAQSSLTLSPQELTPPLRSYRDRRGRRTPAAFFSRPGPSRAVAIAARSGSGVGGVGPGLF